MSKKAEKPSITVREAGKLGGEAVKRKHGVEFYEAIGRKGGEATRDAHGHEFYAGIGKMGGSKGGCATRDTYGPEFYEKIGSMGGQKVKSLIAAGKAAQEESKRDA